MPSQSSLVGESTPDQWIVNGSPDLGSVVLEREMETWVESDWAMKEREKREKMSKMIGGIIVGGKADGYHWPMMDNVS